jgi:crotonobetainyl-CoA:carnitine CoA-transferase CaiB-like acyl-CoA transferase
MTHVMAGIRIIEVADFTFVPAASAILAEWGADVIKIEHAERGDAMRGMASTGMIDIGDGPHVLMEHSNRGKRSFGLDLSTEEGQGLLYRLVAGADVFLTNKLPSVRAKLNIDVDDIRAHNPNIVYARGSGWGQRGPDANRGGFDQLSYWSRSGLAYGVMPAEVDVPPAQPGPAYGDSIGAMTIAGGIAAALLHRQRTGEGIEVDVSLLSTGMWALGGGLALSMQTGEPWLQRPVYFEKLQNPLAAGYRTKDDRFVFLACQQATRYWADLCRVLDREDLIDDERFATAEAIAANGRAAGDILIEEFGRYTFAECRERLERFSGQWSPILNSVESPEEEQVKANGYVLETETKDGTPFRLVTTPVQFNGAPTPPMRSPEFNEHGDAILLDELGLDWGEIVALKLKGVVT